MKFSFDESFLFFRGRNAVNLFIVLRFLIRSFMNAQQ